MTDTAQRDIFLSAFGEFSKMAAEVKGKKPELSEAMEQMAGFLELTNKEMPIDGAAAGFAKWFYALLVVASPYLSDQNVESLQATGQDAAHLTDIMPELVKAINEYKFKNKIKALTFEQVTSIMTDSGKPRDRGIFVDLRERAEALAGANRGLLFNENLKTVLPKQANITLDNVNNKIWRHSYDPAEAKEPNLFELSALTSYIDRENKEGPINTIFTIDFNKLGKNVALTRKLTEFDEQVYLAVASLYMENKTPNSEYVYISVTQIYYAMGGTSRPNDRDRTRIFDSLSKMMFTRLTIDNKREAKYSKRYKLYPYSGPLLVADFLPFPKTINGKQVEQPIRIMALPTLYAYAEARKQVAHFSLEARKITEISSTPQNIALRELLLKRIAKIKTGHARSTIILQSLFEDLGIKNRGAQLRLIKDTADRSAKLPIILDHFKKHKIIYDYELNDVKLELILKNELPAAPEDPNKPDKK